MSDIFREVDEDFRREQLREVWNRYGVYLIVVAVLIIVGTAGYRGWEYWQERQAAATGDRYLAALRMTEGDEPAEALGALEAIVADGSGAYPALAGLRLAAAKAAAGDLKGAVAGYDEVAATR